MIKVGDRVKIKESFHYVNWYSFEQLIVIDIRKHKDGTDVAILDRIFPSNRAKEQMAISLDCLKLDIIYLREKKLKEIFND